MVVALVGIVGLFLGAGIAWVVTSRRAQAMREEVLRTETQIAVRDAELASATALIERQRSEHVTALANLEQTFENLSNRVLDQTVQKFNLSQEEMHRLREIKLDTTLRPLEDLLDEYKRNLADFHTVNAGALSDVKSKAEELLEAQRLSQQETRRLNQLLGRSDQRGRWGEIQLANVLEISGLRQNVDYTMQVSGTNDAGRGLRPDCVVNMPNGTRIAIDAKFPFDAFESALATEDVDERRILFAKHAKDLRGHVKKLNEKGYWEVITPAPEFVVCFVPSDFAISAALDADPDLVTYAAKERVLIAGPTNLWSLLWSVAMVLGQHQVALNAERIYQTAETIFDRIRLVAEPMAKMGRALDTGVAEYNRLVRSFESRLIPAALEVRKLGGAKRAKDLPELGTVNELSSGLNEGKWGIDPENPLPAGVSEILELEGFDEND
ncbi:MAG TPA: DNA recombination protein RmuC [Acidimicrobiales bacterium]|nr:DNA recombination protein RmuC [Acidimicrobiales bacterium]